MAMRILSDDASLIISLLYQVAESYAKASIYGAVRALADLNPERQGRLLAYARDQFSRSEEHTSELQSLMRISYAVFCLKNKRTSLQRPFKKSFTIFSHRTQRKTRDCHISDRHIKTLK